MAHEVNFPQPQLESCAAAQGGGTGWPPALGGKAFCWGLPLQLRSFLRQCSGRGFLRLILRAHIQMWFIIASSFWQATVTQSFRDLHREAFVNTNTKRSTNSNLNTRTFRTSHICIYIYKLYVCVYIYIYIYIYIGWPKSCISWDG